MTRAVDMRLVVEIPPGWVSEPRGEGWIAGPGPALDPCLIVAAAAPAPIFDSARWTTAALTREAPAGAQPAIARLGERTTEHGWPATLYRVSLVCAAGRLLEQRLAAVYRILEYAVVVDARGTDPARWAVHQAELAGLLCAGRPVWSDAPVSIAELLDLDGDLARVPPEYPDPPASRLC